jgi:hypothetical protein
MNTPTWRKQRTQQPETTSQLINIGIIVITRSTIFASDVRKWHAKPEADKTWPAFKDHFKLAQKDIKTSQPTITADSLGFHEANNASSIADQVVDPSQFSKTRPPPSRQNHSQSTRWSNS